VIEAKQFVCSDLRDSINLNLNYLLFVPEFLIYLYNCLLNACQCRVYLTSGSPCLSIAEGRLFEAKLVQEPERCLQLSDKALHLLLQFCVVSQGLIPSQQVVFKVLNFRVHELNHDA
jgi:hypothetical protein